MLKSFCKGAAALAVAFSFSTAAQAEEHVILIVDGSYFPSVVRASAGDMLTFKNESQASHTVTGEGDAWTSGSIAATGGEFSVELTSDTPAGFSGDGEAAGEIIFQ